MLEFPAAEGVMRMAHVEDCACRYGIVENGETKLVDVRCIASYGVPGYARNTHCTNCGDTRGGPVGHDSGECTFRSRPDVDARPGSDGDTRDWTGDALSWNEALGRVLNRRAD